MALAVNTRKGREAAVRAKEALIRFEANHPRFIWFPDYSSSPYDGYVVVNGVITGIFETKSRNAGVDEQCRVVYNGKAYDEYLITAEKIKAGVAHAKAHQINYFIIVYFEMSDCLAIFTMYNYKTGAELEYRTEITRTQATVNGGSAMRENAFIKLAHARIIQL
jgi:hypothetical protein